MSFSFHKGVFITKELFVLIILLYKVLKTISQNIFLQIFKINAILY